MKKMMTRLNCCAMTLVLAAFGTGTLLAQAPTPVPGTHALPVSAADSTKPGFIFNISQVLNSEPNQLSFAEDQLAGLQGTNYADPTAVGVADGPASPANPATAPINFTISSNLINLSIAGGTSKGNFVPDLQMPGLPGTGPNNGTDNAAAEILTYLNLPAGTITMGVNSDDGFRVTIGGAIPQDKFAVNVGQFDGGRGDANTFFQFQIAQAGLYAARLVWENGGGDGNVEWFTILDGLGGTNLVLVNDLPNSGIPAYREVSQSHAWAKSVDPDISATGVAAGEGVHVVLVDGSVPVATNSIALAVDGVSVTPTVTKNANLTMVDYNVPAPWAPRSTHSASLAFTDGSLRPTNTWSWTVQFYPTLDPSWRVTTVDVNKPGFNWNIFANSDNSNKDNSNERAERNLTLQSLDPLGNPLGNSADPTKVYGATGAAAAPNPANAPIHFEIPGTINLDTAVPSMPGAPSLDTTTDGQAAEILTYLTLPAGVVQMIVDSVQGWRLYSGAQPADVFGRVVVAENNGRSGVVKFNFGVPQAGTYPFRMVWENSGGPSHLNWYSINTSGQTNLVNDTANGGVPAYRALTAATSLPPIVSGISPLAALHQQEVANTNIYLLLVDGTHPVNDASVILTVDGQSVTPIKTRSGSYLTVSDGGAAFPGLQLPGDVHSAVLSYQDSVGTGHTQHWAFNNIQVLANIPNTPVTGENFDAYPEATSNANTVPPGWHAWNFTLVNTPGWDIMNKASDSYKDWIIISTTTLTGPIESGALNNDPNQTYNGQPVTNFASGNVLWATSDGRSGPQVQFCTSTSFDLSSVVNPVLIFSSLMRMSAEANSQANGIEYSIDGGNTWHAGIIYVTIAHSRKDYLLLSPDGSLDPDRILHIPWGNLFGFWTDIQSGQTRGGDWASGLEEPVVPSMAPIMAIRSDNTITSTKIDGIRLPLASRQKDVRLRFYQLGNCSWWWGVDNLAFYDIAATVAPVITSISVSGGQVTIRWSNGGTLESSPTVQNPVWTSTGNSSGIYTAPLSPGNKFYHVKR